MWTTSVWQWLNSRCDAYDSRRCAVLKGGNNESFEVKRPTSRSRDSERRRLRQINAILKELAIVGLGYEKQCVMSAIGTVDACVKTALKTWTSLGLHEFDNIAVVKIRNTDLAICRKVVDGLYFGTGNKAGRWKMSHNYSSGGDTSWQVPLTSALRRKNGSCVFPSGAEADTG